VFWSSATVLTKAALASYPREENEDPSLTPSHFPTNPLQGWSTPKKKQRGNKNGYRKRRKRRRGIGWVYLLPDLLGVHTTDTTHPELHIPVIPARELEHGSS
jgi:hypothetical protein